MPRRRAGQRRHRQGHVDRGRWYGRISGVTIRGTTATGWCPCARRFRGRDSSRTRRRHRGHSRARVRDAAVEYTAPRRRGCTSPSPFRVDPLSGGRRPIAGNDAVPAEESAAAAGRGRGALRPAAAAGGGGESRVYRARVHRAAVQDQVHRAARDAAASRRSTPCRRRYAVPKARAYGRRRCDGRTVGLSERQLRA